MYHMIPLPSDYAGKTFVFDMYVGEPNAFKTLTAPILAAQTDISGKFVRDNLLIIATGMFTFVFGLMFLCIGLVFVNYVPEVRSLLVGSCFCMNLAAWLMTYYNILSLFIYTEKETEIEYFCMYIVVPYSYLLLYYIKNLKNDRVYKAIMLVSTAVPILQYALHYFFGIHLRVTLPLYHVVAVLGFVILIYYVAVSNKKNTKESPATLIQLVGLFAFDFGQFFHLRVEFYSKRVDTCAAEFATDTAYMYSTYEEECEANPSTDREKIMVLGGGPNRIGQGIEFDYCCVHASLALREDGYETIMVNCNPETVSTDYDTSDRLYFEPVTLEDVLEIVRIEKPKGVIVQYGGQTPLKLARALEAAGVPVIGTSPDAIDRAEDRERFQHAVERLKLKQPANATVTTI